ncbi:MAG TPA: Mur ligase family protein [Cyclobacteriaceae bacterium]|jgi:UDP-N-acetylmuramate: L-alanyl-gamma-D-glutamyl-meso-diaminopimelate ligase
MPGDHKRIHFIAVGGSVMHNLAIALKRAGNEVSGSDDEIFEPARSALKANGLLPEKEGWFPEKITADIDEVILGMHAQVDNPELLKAQELGIPIRSFPEFIYERSRDKQRIVIAGSHGKTTITAIIVHVLNYLNRKFDYVIGARVKGLDLTVRLSDAPIIVIEGDEYLSSRLDPVPKFIRYRHHIGLISGVAWDHANVFPTEEDYVRQFDIFCDQTPKGGILFYCEQDPMAVMIGKKERTDVTAVGYKSLPHVVENGVVYLTYEKERYPIKIFGSHNYLNLGGARELLRRIGVTHEQFYQAITSFEGASGRLEIVASKNSMSVIRDFAHAPSKVKASVKAVRDLHPDRELVACLELHTYSSLSKGFLPQYKHSLKSAQQKLIYFDPRTVEAKRLEPLSERDIREAFGSDSVRVFTDRGELERYLSGQSWRNKDLLLMSSGTFGGLSVDQLVANLKD